MIPLDKLNELEKELKSGEFEKQFRRCGEIQRGNMLELLEKLMDLGELADEVATRLIYRRQNLNEADRQDN